MNRKQMIDALVAMQQDADKKKKIRGKLNFMKAEAVAQIYAPPRASPRLPPRRLLRPFSRPPSR